MEMKQALTDSGMKLVASQCKLEIFLFRLFRRLSIDWIFSAEKKQLESRIGQLEIDKKTIEQSAGKKK